MTKKETIPMTVLMSVYNTKAKWLCESIDSILCQTFAEFEFIIIDDKSTDGSLEILKGYQAKDNRIILVENEENLGLTKSLNKGLALARGNYIARMDADDISVPERLACQYRYMEEHNDVSVVGGYLYTGKNGSYMLTGYNEDKEIQKVQMLFHNAGVPHPTAMIRSSFLSDNRICYDERIKKSQDYALWTSIISRGGKIRLIPKVVLLYRVHENQISANKKDQIAFAHQVVGTNLKRIIPDYTQEQLEIHSELLDGIPRKNKKEYMNHLMQLENRNKLSRLFPERIFHYQIKAAWLRLSYHRMRYYKKIDFILSAFTLKCLSPRGVSAYYKTYMAPRKVCKQIREDYEANL